MGELRLEFSKTGRARYLSHLDVMRVLQRALTRADVPVAYSEGFNPHMRLSILLPLPLGLESVCELCDVKLSVDSKSVMEAVNAALPEGFWVTGARPPGKSASEIAWAAYELILERAEGFPDGAARELSALTGGGGPLPIEKKSKKGLLEIDIAPFLRGAVWERADRHTMRCRVLLPVKDPSLNPEHVAAAIRRAAPELAPGALYGTRVALFDAKGEVFGKSTCPSPALTGASR